MRIAIVLESPLDLGGGFHQELATACLLNKHQNEYEFVFYTTEKANVAILKEKGIVARYLERHSAGNRIFLAFSGGGWLSKRLMRMAGLSVFPIEKVFLKDGIDLVYFLSPSFLAIFMTRINYIVTVWDLCHRDHPEFPESNFDGEFEGREYIYKNVLQKATAVLADSDLGKANIIRRYGCDTERVHVARFLPSIDLQENATIDIKVKYFLLRPYVFYPAQFWAHKNHVYVLDGVSLLRKKYGVTLDVVFSGNDKGNLGHVLEYARQLGLTDNVHYVGFLPRHEMASFYKEAVALVMPTYFGPTNIPPLEAFSAGCPVCYSDLPGMSEQVGTGAFLMDLKDPSSLAEHLQTILNDPKSVREKKDAGRRLLAQWTEDDYWHVVKGILDGFFIKMKCWKAC